MQLALSLFVAFTLYWFLISIIFVNSDQFYAKLSQMLPKSLKQSILKAEDVKSHATRTEFLSWSAFLIIFYICFILITIVGLSMQINFLNIFMYVLFFTFFLILLPPAISQIMRRLNYNGFNRKFILLVFAPLGGFILLILCLIEKPAKSLHS